jgi:hypothetical protein
MSTIDVTYARELHDLGERLDRAATAARDRGLYGLCEALVDAAVAAHSWADLGVQTGEDQAGADLLEQARLPAGLLRDALKASGDPPPAEPRSELGRLAKGLGLPLSERPSPPGSAPWE